MKKRIIWKMFVLEIVTLGIYRLYWLIKTRNEMMKANRSVKIKSPWFLLVPVIVLIAALAIGFSSLIYSMSQTSKCPKAPATVTTQTDRGIVTSIDNEGSYNTDNCPAVAGANISTAISIGVFYLAIPVAFILYVIWLWSYCHGVEAVSKGKTNFALALVIMILVPDGIDILIIQDGFNKIATK